MNIKIITIRQISTSEEVPHGQHHLCAPVRLSGNSRQFFSGISLKETAASLLPFKRTINAVRFERVPFIGNLRKL